MTIQNRADQHSKIIRGRTRGYEPNLPPLCSLSNLCLYGTDTNDRMAETSKMDIV
jgi:hypothetical protein